MDAWEEQIRSPHPMTGSPSAMLSKLKSLPSFGPAGSFWVQTAEQWQKAWADAMAF